MGLNACENMGNIEDVKVNYSKRKSLVLPFKKMLKLFMGIFHLRKYLPNRFPQIPGITTVTETQFHQAQTSPKNCSDILQNCEKISKKKNEIQCNQCRCSSKSKSFKNMFLPNNPTLPQPILNPPIFGQIGLYGSIGSAINDDESIKITVREPLPQDMKRAWLMAESRSSSGNSDYNSVANRSFNEKSVEVLTSLGEEEIRSLLKRIPPIQQHDRMEEGEEDFFVR